MMALLTRDEVILLGYWPVYSALSLSNERPTHSVHAADESITFAYEGIWPLLRGVLPSVFGENCSLRKYGTPS
jgi:hypothetical protein